MDLSFDPHSFELPFVRQFQPQRRLTAFALIRFTCPQGVFMLRRVNEDRQARRRFGFEPRWRAQSGANR